MKQPLGKRYQTLATVIIMVVILAILWSQLGGKISTLNRSPLADAVFNSNLPDVQKLLNSGASPNETLPVALQLQSGGKMMSEYRRSLFGFVIKDAGSPVLVSAALSGNKDIVSLLLDKGAAINAPDQYGQTALIAAAWKGSPDCVSVLLGKKADVTIKDSSNKTALDWANSEGHADVAALLTAAGAK